MSARLSTETPADQDVDAYDVADYVAELAHELSELARGAGLGGTAAALELARRAAETEARRLRGQANAAPDDAA